MNIGDLTGTINLEDRFSSALELVQRRVQAFADDIGKAFGVAVLALGAVTAAVGAAIGSISALGSKGSVILGVEQAFDRLARAAGTTGDALVGALSEGVKDTIDSMVLMQSTSRLLSSGFKLNVDDAKLMGQAARELGKSTGTDAAGGLQMLSNALLTGRTRGLAMAGITVDLKKAELDYAKSLGVAASELSNTGTLEAKRIAILQATRQYVDRLGVSEVSFKEKLQQAGVAIGNWTDSLAKAVASSPNVMKAMDAIGNAIKTAFGGDSQKVLDTIVGWINRFADVAAQYGPFIIQTLADIWHGVLDIWKAVTDAWSLVPDWFKNIALQAGLAGGAVYLAGNALVGMSPSLLETSSNFATLTSGIKDFGTMTTTAFANISKVGLSGVVKGWGVALAGFFAPAITGFTAVAGAVGTFTLALLANPITWVVAGLVTMVGALRLVTGSWEFILVPLRAAWQAFEDLRAIQEEIIDVVLHEMRPAITVMKDLFDIAATVIGGVFTAKLVTARNELQMMWELFKNMPGPLRALISALDYLHEAAERARANDIIPKLPDIPAGLPARMISPGGADRMTDFVPRPDPQDLINAQEILKKLNAIRAANYKIEQDQLAASYQARAAMEDFNGKRAMDELERQYKERQDALANNLAVSDKMRADAWAIQSDDLNARGMAELARIEKHYQEVEIHSTASLQEVARKAQKIYLEMQGRSGEFSKATIEHFKELAEGAADAVDGVVSLARRIKGHLTDALQGIPQIFIDAFTGGGGIAGAFKAIGTSLLNAITKEIFNPLMARLSGFLVNFFKGLAGIGGKLAGSLTAGIAGTALKAGPMVGGLIGPMAAGGAGAAGVGAAGGAPLFNPAAVAFLTNPITIGIAGAIVGGYLLYKKLHKTEAQKLGMDIGRDLGAAIPEEALKLWEKESKEFGRQVVMSMHLDEIIAYAGGLTVKNFDVMAGRLRDTFAMLGQGILTAAQATEVLDKNFQNFAKEGTSRVGVLNAKLVEMIKLDEQYNTNSEAVAAVRASQVAKASTGFELGIGIPAAALKSFDELTKKADELKKKIAGDGKKSEMEGWQKELAEINKELAKVGPLYQITKIHSQEAASAISSSLMGIVAANMEAGMTFIQAAKLAGPSVQALQEQLTKTGFEGGAAFGLISEVVRLANDEIAGPALESLHGYTEGLVGMGNLGLLNQEMFSGLTSQISGTAAALEAQGFTGQAVHAAMRDDIQAIWELQQETGYAVDDTTQALINQMVAEGMVGAEHKSTTQQMLDASNRMVDVLEAMATFMGVTLPAAAQTGANGVNDAFEGIDPDLGSALDPSRLNLPEIPIELSVDPKTLPDLEGAANEVGLALDSVGEAGDLAGRMLNEKLTQVGVSGLTGDSDSILSETMIMAAALKQQTELASIDAGLSLASIADNMPEIPDIHINIIRHIIDEDDDGGATGYSTGGVVYAATGTKISHPGSPRGSDVVPAWLTPRERVLSISENEAYERDLATPNEVNHYEIEINVNAIDSQSVADAVRKPDGIADLVITEIERKKRGRADRLAAALPIDRRRLA